MKTRIFTYVECPCGHRGALIESLEIGDLSDRRYRTCLRSLTHAGTYDGSDGLFARMTPGCPVCGRSLGPDDIVGRSELQGSGEVLRPKEDPGSAETTLSVGA
ncbi:hypothetical protein [Paraburkholderia aromaticivorans]|uniref:hypothetical protein n=1 Tax=Paraburkholderia aromaticivorans TaxID=2026199 RepID=UPI001455F3BE|nr:hypothetical protein [Paraburkholderia aromaticivorans]